MINRKLRITLIHHPTVALKIGGFSGDDFEVFAGSGVYLGNVYRKIIPPSLPRVASVLERHLDADVSILDLRVAGFDQEETYKEVDWEGYRIEARRIGAPFAEADDAIADSDWIGLSSHFTFESGVVRDLIAHARKVNPRVRVMVGGADVKARSVEYLGFGADLAFVGDVDPGALLAPAGRPRVVGPYSHPFHELIEPAFHKLEHLASYTDSHDGPVPDGVPYPIGFIHFTRGCPRECAFCESRKSRFETQTLEDSITMIRNYRKAGIRTVNFADDNLLLMAAQKGGRERLLELLRTMREEGFAWEFPNGLEIGRLVRGEDLDDELMEALFSHSRHRETGEVVGGYRVYVPVETFDERSNYSKLKTLSVQNRIIGAISRAGIVEMDFGVVLPPSANAETFEATRKGYLEIRKIVEGSGTRARYAVFHLIPIAEFRSMTTKYSVEEFPEGWNFYFPVYDGDHLSARELFERRLRLIKEIDNQNFVGMQYGQYAYA